MIQPEQRWYIFIPPLSSTTAASGGIKISWGKVSGASGYVVYRKTSGGSWTIIGNTTSTGYTDKTASAGTTYYYTVRAYKGSLSTANGKKYNAAYWSGYDSTGVTGKYIKMPVVKSASAESSGTKLTWNKVSGATGYVIWRKTSNTSWTRIGTTTGTSFTDTSSRTSGTTYYYTIRAYSGDINTANSSTFNSNYWSYYDTTGTKAVYLSNPVINSTTKAGTNGVTITWNKVKGANGYAVFHKTSGGKWTFAGTTTSTSYTDSAVTDGKKYYFTVRAYTGSVSTATSNKYNAAYWSGYNSTGVVGKYIKAPIVTATRLTSSTKITWNAVSGASGYIVWRKSSGGTWTRVAQTTSTSYTDTTYFSSGSVCYYAVRAYSGSLSVADSNHFNSLYWSYYNTSGEKSVNLGVPSLNSKTSANHNGINISWNKVSGASGYAVYRKISGGSWKMIGTTTSTSYTDTSSLSNGTTYYYTVRAYSGNVSKAKSNLYKAEFWSYFDLTGIKSYYIQKPTLNNTTTTSSGVKVSWNKVSGASGYAVYRKASGGSWEMIGTTTSTDYTDKSSLSSNTVYYYTVRAYKGNLSTAKANEYNSFYWSGYDSSGVIYTIEGSEMNVKAQQYSSKTNYLILVDTTENKVGIYTGSKNNWTRKYYYTCTSGATSSPTVKGQFTTKSKGKSFGSGYTCWYYTQFYGSYLFHSVLYQPGSMTEIKDGRLGINASHGCVRLSLENAKWIYDNIPTGTTVIIY